VAGVVKGGYDVALWRWARRLPIVAAGVARRPSRAVEPDEEDQP